MGGFGSGRPSIYGRRRVESCRSLDVNRLKRAGCLKPGWCGVWQWTRDGEQIASINFSAAQNSVALSYRVRIDSEDWEDIRERVPFITTACCYGGTRPYFLCPGVVNGRPCGRRVVKLYIGGHYFLCRHCYRLSYASQGEDALDRATRRREKLSARLATVYGDDNHPSFFPQRPKGMWHQTYERRCAEIIAAEERADAIFTIKAGRMLARFGHPDFADI